MYEYPNMLNSGDRLQPFKESCAENGLGSRLGFNEAHIWKYKIETESKNIDYAESLLSDEEKRRADKNYIGARKDGFILNRGLLRLLLGYYLHLNPKCIKFAYNSRGKPMVLGMTSENRIAFNLSHSNNTVLLVFAKTQLAGIDIEYLKPGIHFENIAERYFFPSEHKMILDQVNHSGKVLFYSLWTCKEAFLKAIGCGLEGLEKVRIRINNNGFHIDVKTSQSFRGLRDWTLLPFYVAPDYAAAAALKGRNLNFKFINLGNHYYESAKSRHP